ncbi:MAG: serine/threonine-protein kinase, partial [Acidobacteriota bacterium]
MDMTPERWREIEGLVDQALRLPGPDRARFLIGQCAGDEAKLEQVLDLVLASSEAQAIATPAWVPAAESEDSASDPGAGAEGESLTQAENTATPGPGQRTIGSFHVLRTLGRGGMGTVYLAEQHAPVARQVAIKVAHQPLGSEGRLRLAAERQAMARLTHPNIARMLEAGSTDDGHPYFAMELVDGPPITTYCDEHQLGLEARLRLFLAVCAGVQHAHQKGILHRDLKPTNILVSEIDSKPVPKIIDFGIAKALDQPLIDNTLHTGERILGTPAYLSPEALSSPDGSPTDTRGDVYSLGVLLLELLIGERPFAKAEGETPLSQWRRKTEEDPKSPTRQWLNLDPSSRDTIASQRGSEARTWGRRIRGDLDWIVLRAIAREPAERYPGVSELAADVDRHLKDEPVLAGPPTASYQLRKLVRRHRGPVTFSVLLLFALAGGFVARSLEAARANRQAAEARLAREETEEVVEFLAGLF